MTFTERFNKARKEWASTDETIILLVSLIISLLLLFNPIGRSILHYLAYVLCFLLIVGLVFGLFIEVSTFIKHYKRIKVAEKTSFNEDEELIKGDDVYYFLELNELKRLSEFFYAYSLAGTFKLPSFVTEGKFAESYKNHYLCTTEEYVRCIEELERQANNKDAFPGYGQYIREHFVVFPAIYDKENGENPLVSTIELGGRRAKEEAVYAAKLVRKRERKNVFLVINNDTYMDDVASQTNCKHIYIII